MIVIPMAGLSRRFREAGYDLPKYRLPLHGRTLFAHAVGSFAACFGSEDVLLVARAEPGIEAFIRAECQGLGIADPRIVILPEPTAGQADTVRLGLERAAVPPGTPLTIFNIDTFRPGFRYPDTPWMPVADGYLEVMPGSDPGFSYVLPRSGDAGQRVAATAEKQVISDLASTGLYWFRRCADFLDAMAGGAPAARAGGELYVAPLYNALVARGLDIRYHPVPAAEVVFCGVPSQYEALLRAPALTLQGPGGGV